MARSTKLQKVVTDALANRITTTESGITAIQARNLLDAGDNVSELINDAGYQNATQVDAKITAVVGAAPAALDTLGEIAAALADEEGAIAALIAQDTANATAITAIQSVNTTQDTAITDLATDVATLQTVSGKVNIASDSGVYSTPKIIFTNDNNFTVSPGEDEVIVGLSNSVFDLNRFPVQGLDLPIGTAQQIFEQLLRNSAISRFVVIQDFQLDFASAACQNLINQTAGAITVSLPSVAGLGLDFEVINHSTSTQNIIFAGETIVPGTRHAVKWDGVEWVIM